MLASFWSPKLRQKNGPPKNTPQQVTNNEHRRHHKGPKGASRERRDGATEPSGAPKGPQEAPSEWKQLQKVRGPSTKPDPVLPLSDSPPPEHYPSKGDPAEQTSSSCMRRRFPEYIPVVTKRTGKRRKEREGREELAVKRGREKERGRCPSF